MKGNDNSKNILADAYTGSLTPAPSIIYPKSGGAVYTNKRRILTTPTLVNLNTGYLIPTKINMRHLYYWFYIINLGRYAVDTAITSVNATRVSKLLLPFRG